MAPRFQRGHFSVDGRSLERLADKGAFALDSRGFVYTDNSGRIWIGARGRVAMYDGRAIREYSEKDGIGGGQVTAILHSRAGTLWLVNYSGLHKFSQDRFERITVRNGLPSSRLFSILEDEAGDLWLGTAVGIVNVTPDEIEKSLEDPEHTHQLSPVRSFRRTARSPYCARASHRRAGTGRHAVVRHRQRRRSRRPEASRGHIDADADHTGRCRGGRPGNGDDVCTALPADVKRLEFQFTAVNLRSSAKVRFRYLLEGFDTAWVDAGARRAAVYTNLEAGEYRFRVMASDNGVWNSEEAIWGFRIQPVDHRTRTFYFASFAAAGLYYRRHMVAARAPCTTSNVARRRRTIAYRPRVT